MSGDYIFTSESVTEGHPDKIADQISDTILDAMLKEDANSRVACETMMATGLAIVSGEIRTKSYVDIQKVIREKIIDIGYDHSDKGFDGHSCSVLVSIHEQSSDIAQGVDEVGGEHEQGAGDQGMMFGYAIKEADNFMPYTIDFSHKLAQRLSYVRKNNIMPLLRPDGKTQVSAVYENDKMKRIEAIVVSSQHASEMTQKQIREGIMETVIKEVVPSNLIDNKTKIFINPTGRFVIGGPMGDCGLTGRKIIVDTYGGHGSHGGGAFSGKDPSKVDRSAAYAARHVAKNIVAAGLADRALVQVAYAIGIAEPVSFMVNTFGTERYPIAKINAAINKVFNMKPKAIITRLNLLRPIYAETAAYGHFGRTSEHGFTWEKLDKVEELKSLIK
ncbi:MAG TPA: methionine adenosyltransferase [Bacteriovoracaceae bacterium]|nr:methionine adenosyltransferase [Bacteriovoracaceae bacterium]